MNSFPYLSLDEARHEIHKRRHCIELIQSVEDFLLGRFLPGLGKQPKAALIRSVLSPDVGFEFFLYCSKYVGLPPLFAEHSNDLFIGLSEEKLGLARLRLTRTDQTKVLSDIVDFKAFHGKMIPDVRVLSGDSLIDFHHDLIAFAGHDISIENVSSYFHSFGKPSDYYPFYLANFIAHGILFENFDCDETTREFDFTRDVVVKSLETVRNTFGVYPLIVRLYPENQTDEEDFYWWTYPKRINSFLLDFGERHKCKQRRI